MPQGKYIAFNADSDSQSYRNRAQEARAKGWTESFTAALADGMGVEPAEVTAFRTKLYDDYLEGLSKQI